MYNLVRSRRVFHRTREYLVGERRDLVPADEPLSAARCPDRVLPEQAHELVGELVLLCVLESLTTRLIASISTSRVYRCCPSSPWHQSGTSSPLEVNDLDAISGVLIWTSVDSHR